MGTTRCGEAFLANPDLFPARRAGEPWGDAVIDLVRRFGAYCREGGPPAARADTAGVESLVFRAAEADFRTIDVRGWEYALDLDAAPEAVRLAGLRLVARLDWRPGLCGALWTPDGGGAEFAGIFENFCRVLVAYRLLERGGAVLHCAAISDRGGARLFLGRSGAGKSTVSRLALARGLTVLSDDLNALFPGGGEARPPFVEKLPFTGDYGDSRSPSPAAPLAGLYRLAKSEADSLQPLSRAAAAACLLACSPFVNADAHRRERLLANLLALLPAGPVAAWELRFSLGGGFWPILNR